MNKECQFYTNYSRIYKMEDTPYSFDEYNLNAKPNKDNIIKSIYLSQS